MAVLKLFEKNEIREIPIGKEEIIIGRDASCDITVSDLSVSRKHAKIVRENDQFKIIDLNSKNGTFVNNKMVKEAVLLEDDDKIQIGSNITIIFKLFEEEKPEFSLEDATEPLLGHTTLEMQFTRVVAQPQQSFGKRINPEQLAIVFTVSELLQANLPFKQKIEQILNEIISDFDADTAQLYILDKESKKLKLYTSVGKKYPISKVSKTIIRYVINSSKAVITSDALKDERFASSQSIIEKAIHSVLCIPLIAFNKTWGVLYLYKDTAKGSFDKELLEILSTIGLMIASTLANIVRALENDQNFFSLLGVLIRTLELKNPQSQGHSERVANLSLSIAQEMNLPIGEQKLLFISSLLHDIGKITLPPETEKERQSPEWWQKHIIETEKLIKDVPDSDKIANIIRYHHWRMDNSGYPKDIDKNSVSLLARILSLANFFDNLTTYGLKDKIELQTKDAIIYIKFDGGKEFDKSVEDSLISVYNKNKLYQFSYWSEIPFSAI